MAIDGLGDIEVIDNLTTSDLLAYFSWDDIAYGKGTFIAIATNRSKYAVINLNPCVNGVPFLVADKSN